MILGQSASRWAIFFENTYRSAGMEIPLSGCLQPLSKARMPGPE
jgi:hypothetical protein